MDNGLNALQGPFSLGNDISTLGEVTGGDLISPKDVLQNKTRLIYCSRDLMGCESKAPSRNALQIISHFNIF